MKRTVLLSAACILAGSTFAQRGVDQSISTVDFNYAGNHVIALENLPVIDPLRGGGVANDDCGTAAMVNLVDSVNCATQAIAGTNTGATASAEGTPACDDPSTAGLSDVWYTFNSGNNNVIRFALSPASNMTDWGMEIWDVCGGGSGFCTIMPEGGMTLSGFTENTTFVIRVFSNQDFGTPGDFTLCVSPAGAISSIDELEAGTFNIFPNPAVGWINISSERIRGNVAVELFDMTGRSVMNTNVNMDRNTAAIELDSKLASGTYSMVLTSTEGRSVLPIMIK